MQQDDSEAREAIRLVVQQALSGDCKAVSELMRQINRYFPERFAGEDPSLPPSEEDLKLLEDYVRRRLGGQEPGKTEGSDDGEF